LECCLDVDWSSIFRGRLKLPLSDSPAGPLVKTFIDAAKNAHLAYRSVRVNDRIEDYRSRYVLLHQLQRVSRVYFTSGGGLSDVFCGSIRVLSVGAMIV